MPDYSKPDTAFRLFQEHLAQDRAFTLDEFLQATGYSRSSFRTYRSKKWADFLAKTGPGEYRVLPEFGRFTLPTFRAHFSQKTPVYAQYDKTNYGAVVEYELLMPFTHEAELREALDDLFYADTVRNRVEELGVDAVASWVRRDDGEQDAHFLDRVAQFVGEMFGGYSVGTVQGRFRAGPLTDLATAADMARRREKYIVNEFVASVRLMFPDPSLKRCRSRSARSGVGSRRRGLDSRTFS